MGDSGVSAPESADPADGDWALPDSEEGLRLYHLPGTDRSDKHASCALPLVVGHLSGPDYHWLRVPQRGCRSYDCPVKVTKGKRWGNRWSVREAARIASTVGPRCRHVIVSPPHDAGLRVTASVMRDLRASAYVALREVYPHARLQGACVVHPLRCVPQDRQGGHDGLHFHFALKLGGLGRFDGARVRFLNERTGWVVKVLESIAPTFRLAVYELHHAGRWVERAAYGKDLDGGVVSCPTANSPEWRYVTEAVTWLGPRSAPPPDLPGDLSAGRICPVCHVEVPAEDWSVLIWCWSREDEPPGDCGASPESAWRPARELSVWGRA